MKVNEILGLPFFKEVSPSLLSSEPPVEIVIGAKNELTGEPYKYIPIETLESLMDIFFPGWSDKGRTEVDHVSISGCIIHAECNIMFGGELGREKYGTASYLLNDKAVLIGDKPSIIKWQQLLPLHTPRVYSEAKKAAIKSICPLFGRNLNRGVDEIVFYDEEVKEKPEADIIIMKKYENAKKRNDTKLMEEILENYYINKFD